MSNNTKRSFNCYLKLSDAEKAEFDKTLAEYKAAGRAGQILINEDNQKEVRKINEVQTGPLSGGCPYCGK